MDDRVKRALAQWPDVPDAYGWLALDRRGRWRLRGESIAHRGLVDFINRNYIRHPGGGYAFQNGPQCVHVELDYLPFVWSWHQDGLRAHTDALAKELLGAWLDTEGELVLQTELGPGLLRGQDLEPFSSQFVLRDGRPATPDFLLENIEALMAGQSGDLMVRYGATEIALGMLESSRAEQQFGYLRCPRRFEPSSDATEPA